MCAQQRCAFGRAFGGACSRPGGTSTRLARAPPARAVPAHATAARVRGSLRRRLPPAWRHSDALGAGAPGGSSACTHNSGARSGEPSAALAAGPAALRRAWRGRSRLEQCLRTQQRCAFGEAFGGACNWPGGHSGALCAGALVRSSACTRSSGVRSGEPSAALAAGLAALRRAWRGRSRQEQCLCAQQRCAFGRAFGGACSRPGGTPTRLARALSTGVVPAHAAAVRVQGSLRRRLQLAWRAL
jgi:hypothetical protein